MKPAYSNFKVAINPFARVNLYTPEVAKAYSGKRKGELEPHLFAVAEDAYRCMTEERQNQSIIVSGESGAGSMLLNKLTGFSLKQNRNVPF
jgi:myosin-5